jgi:CIC family chloride channel protein
MSAQSGARQHKSRLEGLGDFTTTASVIPISLIAIVIGVIGAYVAWCLLKLIGIFTNLFYYHRFSTSFASPAGNHLGVYEILVPVIG